jgi:hypothetical protein
MSPAAALRRPGVWCRAVYVAVSYRLFTLTGRLKTAVVPNKAGRELVRNVVLIGVCGSVLWLLSLLVISAGGWNAGPVYTSSTLLDASSTRQLL